MPFRSEVTSTLNGPLAPKIQIPFRPTFRLIGALSTLALMTHAVQGAIVISFQEVGSDVVVSGSGTIDTTGLTKIPNSTSAGGLILRPVLAVFGVGSGPVGTVDLFSSVLGPTDIGTGPIQIASSATGSAMALINLSALQPFNCRI
jgi:hypothetical protein